ncbi:MAG: hypothetical protein N2235_26455, partial [Fischerella sp.]|nr:hypothetical protein [Fischerella sp.]
VHIIQECKLLNLMIKASTPEDVSTIFNILDSVHGIGPTIASKLVMYTLREIGVGQIPYKNLYPAVIPIIKEYHNSELGKELKQKYGANAITIIFESLKKLGDPFAIDALYYIHREEPSLKKLL